jgi:hypothetical protein
MSGSLKTQLKKLQEAKQYEAMIVLLEASNEPQKKVVIARIKQRMKEEAKAAAPVPAPTTTAKPAGKPLPGTGEAPVKQKAPSDWRAGCRHIAKLAIFALGVTPVIFFIGHLINSHINRYQWRMEDVCRSIYDDEMVYDEITVNQWFNGCKLAAAQSIDFYGESVAYCYNNENGTERRFMECLAEEDVNIFLSTVKEAAP